MSQEEQFFTPIGTYIATPLATFGEHLTRDGIFIDRRNGTPMEMDAYSAYLALKAEEQNLGTDRSAERRFIVETLEKRRVACGGFWNHGAWTESDQEIHLRFTAAAIRLLVEAHTDGLYPDVDLLASLIRKHISFNEELTPGIWFLHDTLELGELGLSDEKPFPNRVWNSSRENCLVLNTHLDTALTLMDAVTRVSFSAQDQAEFRNIAQRATNTLLFVMQPRNGPLFSAFAFADGLIRAFMLNSHETKNRWRNYAKWRMIDHYYKHRRRAKAYFKTFAFPDGYMERDIGLLGYFFDYHVYNLHDITRFVFAAERGGFITAEQMKTLSGIVDRALTYACSGPYANYVRLGIGLSGKANVLAEAIIASGALPGIGAMPPNRREMLAEILRTVAPTPAILGYDNFILRKAVHDGRSATFTLLNGTELQVQY